MLIFSQVKMPWQLYRHLDPRAPAPTNRNRTPRNGVGIGVSLGHSFQPFDAFLAISEQIYEQLFSQPNTKCPQFPMPQKIETHKKKWGKLGSPHLV